MENITLNVRVNFNDKQNFERFCNNVGMNVSTAINMFIKTVLREQRLPFEIRSDEFEEFVYNKLKEAEAKIESNSIRYSEEEMINRINKKLKG